MSRETRRATHVCCIFLSSCCCWSSFFHICYIHSHLLLRRLFMQIKRSFALASVSDVNTAIHFNSCFVVIILFSVTFDILLISFFFLFHIWLLMEMVFFFALAMMKITIIIVAGIHQLISLCLLHCLFYILVLLSLCGLS